MKNLKKSLAFVLALGMFSTIAYAVDIPSEVVPIGKAVGIKMTANGAIIVKLSDVNGENGVSSPGEIAGLLEGDVITFVNKSPIKTNEDLSNAILKTGTNTCSIEILRDGLTKTFDISPIKCVDDNTYKIGVWVRDSMAGIGTITFVDPKTKKFGALGHGINDIDSGILMSLTDGAIVRSNVSNVKKGVKGDAGELGGTFSNEKLGDLYKNTNIGIFGILDSDSILEGKESYPVGLKSDIKTGPAQIITNVDSDKSEVFDIEIVKVLNDGDKTHRDMMIKITDPSLIDKTGGIVQGMSGSPILQNGKIIGAVTHVLINNPEKGYGVFIENMLNESLS